MHLGLGGRLDINHYQCNKQCTINVHYGRLYCTKQGSGQTNKVESVSQHIHSITAVFLPTSLLCVHISLITYDFIIAWISVTAVCVGWSRMSRGRSRGSHVISRVCSKSYADEYEQTQPDM